MDKFLHSTGAQVVLGLAAVAVLVAVGIYVIGKFRYRVTDERVHTSDLLTNFRELHAKGELSEKEFRTIKSMLAERLQDQLKDTEESG